MRRECVSLYGELFEIYFVLLLQHDSFYNHVVDFNMEYKPLNCIFQRYCAGSKVRNSL